MDTTLEQQFNEAFELLNIKPEYQDSINHYLGILKWKDIETYEHSIRAGLLGEKITEYMHLDQKALFFAGTLHDVGKILVPNEILKKKKDFGKSIKDRMEMNKHPTFSYQLLRDIHPFTAAVVVRHHTFQENPYPKRLPPLDKPFLWKNKANIEYYARILALADFYDAIMHRENDFSGAKRKLAHEEAKGFMLEKNPDQIVLINNLYDAQIF